MGFSSEEWAALVGLMGFSLEEWATLMGFVGFSLAEWAALVGFMGFNWTGGGGGGSFLVYLRLCSPNPFEERCPFSSN